MSPFHPSRWPERLPERYWLAQARVPAAVLVAPRLAPDDTVALLVEDGRIAAIEASPPPAADHRAAVFDLAGATVLPAFVEAHTHLDQGERLASGLAPAAERDRLAGAARTREEPARGSEAELRARLGFALRTALAHGTRALNTFVAWPEPAHPEGPLAWRVLEELQREWAGRLELRVTSLLALGRLADEAAAVTLARTLALGRAALGLEVSPGAPLQWLPRAFDLAERFDLALDFHVDRHLDPPVASIGHIARLARLARERGYGTRVVCSHACVLGALADAERDALLDEIAASGLALTCLPAASLALQERGTTNSAACGSAGGEPGPAAPRRTPRQRGLLPVHEARARGIALAFASDCHRDLVLPAGDLDLLHTLALAAHAAQLDDAVFAWADTVTTAPARRLGLPDAQGLCVGASADLVLHPGRTSAEVLSRPHPRQIIRAGQRLSAEEATPPDFRDLDRAVERKPERRAA